MIEERLNIPMMKGNKHAYSIIEHHNWNKLQHLIDLIDYFRNDIYLYVDAKSLESYQSFGGVKTMFSKLIVVDEVVDVEWSDVSLCDAEVKLFEKIMESGVNYQYVHLISGSDLPVMKQDKIYTFFDTRSEEFIDVRYDPKFKKRIKYYHFFVRGRRDNALRDAMRRLMLLPQWFFVDRLKHTSIKYAYGSEWCSLTLRAVSEIVSKYQQYRYMFEKTTCSDELYKQMILVSAEEPFTFAKEGNLRYIRFDHKKASPRIITMKDYNEIMNSGCIFARKFEEGTEVYKKIYQHVRAI